jgi:hypothetical protein
MENANPISAIPLDAEPRLETATADPLSKNEPPRQLANIKVARKRTKTGCLSTWVDITSRGPLNSVHHSPANYD